MSERLFTGNIFIFHAFDVGEEISFERVKQEKLISLRSSPTSKYFKNYHIPLNVSLSSQPHHKLYTSAKAHSFGALTLRYQIPFTSTLESLRAEINGVDRTYHAKAFTDADTMYRHLKPAIKQAHFFHNRRSYLVIQINPEPDLSDALAFQNEYGHLIASMLRFETESLSEYQKNEMLESAFGYYRGDLIMVDIEASFMYDDEYENILDLFEFVNMQQLELQFFDRVLDKQLNAVYERGVTAPPVLSYLPFIGTKLVDPVGDLDKLRVDISVITERLDNSIKLSGEAYYTELYKILLEKLEINAWRDSLNRKLAVIRDIGLVYQTRIDATRADMLSVAVIILVFLELVMGTINVLKH